MTSTNIATPGDPRRRTFLKQAGGGASLLAAGLALGPGLAAPAAARDAAPGTFWPNGIRLVV